MDNPQLVLQKYYSVASQASRERENHLKRPSLWRCSARTFDGMMPSSPALSSLAANLPAWGTGQVVTFTSFAPLMLELQRVYECKLQELEEDAIAVVFGFGTDIFEEGGSEPAKSFHHAERVELFAQRMKQERERSRLALERTLQTFRSFELAAPFTVETYCLQREATDLRNALALLADTVSCMPSIWDVATSLHTRAEE